MMIKMKSFLFFAAVTIAVFSFFTITTSDLAADRSALLALRSAIGGRSLLWNQSAPSPCAWVGVNCSSNRVSQLRLPGMGLTGSIPVGTIGNLTQVHTMSLRFNALSGPLPSDLSALSNLRNLYLQDNLFSGPIPDSIFSLSNLVRLNLAHNNFSGSISPSFGKLTRLATLYLQNNRLNGSISYLDLSLVQFNVSNNQLTGEVPRRFSGMPTSVFLGNSLCGGPLVACNGTSSAGGNNLSGGAIAGIVIGSVLGVLLIVVILVFLCRRKRSEKELKSSDERVVRQVEMETPQEKRVDGEDRSASSGGFVPAGSKGGQGKENVGADGGKSLIFFGKIDKTFDLEDLLKASAEVLGKGVFGTTYKAGLEIGTTVAVKRLKDANVSDKEFKERMEEVGKMNHENLVPLRAYYFGRDEKLLVYDYIPMGSLSALLHGNKGTGRTALNWETRSLIALGAARGIAYLHSRGLTVSHGNIKSSNVLLTKSYEARVSDFGLAQLVGPTPTPNRVAGYRAPEVTDPHKVSQKADVYSFGVLLLELLTGKVPSHAVSNEEGVDLPRWVQSVVQEEWTAEVFDLELLRYQNVEEDMVQLLQLAVDCTAEYPDKRRSMAEVARQIEEICRSSLQEQQDPHNEIIDAD